MAAASPEELDTLLEDALLMNDRAAVAALFWAAEVRVCSAGRVLSGADATDLLARCDYVASGCCERVAADVALAVSEATVTLCRRGTDGQWKVLVVVLTSPAT